VLPADGDADNNTSKGHVMLMTAVNVIIVVALCVELCVLLTRTDTDV
jgi:hypothetical protein